MPTEQDQDLVMQPAWWLAAQIRGGELSARELTQACLGQVQRHNPSLNALVTLDAEAALQRAAQADEYQARGGQLGALHGLPVAHKDSFPTAGMRTTWGSTVYAEHVPSQDALIVRRQAEAGAILLGKSNLPEFGAGSQTFNQLFGATLNPYEPSLTCGGSSGGSAVALATGMVALADGTDMGGSLRNPASFCNIVGLRPSIGRVPNWPNSNSFGQLTVAGPMGRCVADVALLLSVIAGPDRRDPLSLQESGEGFASLPALPVCSARVAYSPDLGGLPVDPQVRAVIDAGAQRLAALGCSVEHAEPSFAGAGQAFQVLRALTYASGYASLLESHRGQLKDTLVWNIELVKSFSAEQVIAAEQVRARLFRETQQLLETYDFLIAPVSQVPPFPVQQAYVERIGDEPMHTYIDWMQSCSFITLTGHPSISVPCGFTAEGLPVGLQIVGRYRDERSLLQFAQRFETASRVHTARRPI
ncbi:amidase [Pseudomonas sp. Fl5BN2]|uniref:amidase n=1 Tax=unclassified Pseudomonas TaxID=196821 RepID=UPI0013787E56|nr:MULTISPECIES: amidase [unclassified Pseudomonas]NBF05990.1 amidase [Pseudomonas sp. Fl5BN2]NBF10880.1 amidase [Pseudomonas sp. Fl4BN1]